MLTDLTAIFGGLLVTIFLGWLCGAFLRRTVTLEYPERFKDFKESEKGGGGVQLGTLERVLFFAAFWLEQSVFVAGWLTFKVAAKWAVWQHIVRIPEDAKDNDPNYLSQKRILSSILLGRFLNGTLYNVFCAVIGYASGKFVLRIAYSFSTRMLYGAVCIVI